MSATFRDDLQDLYQGEIIGEALFDRMLEFYDDPVQRYKVALMLQLETETKARLRPAMLELGADIRELDASREAGLTMAAALAGKPWAEAMTTLHEALIPYVERYTAIAANAPARYRELAQSMVRHESALLSLAACEAAGDGANSAADIIAQLQYPLPAPA
jgi:hypothetical protein